MPGKNLRMVFGPQHGFYGETQDNMIEWEGYTHPVHGIPVHSLYGRTRSPDPEMLRGVDCLVVDLQDVGARYYTYIYTMANCMRVCGSEGIPVVVLDRPNPLGYSIVEGKPLQRGFESFVGMYPIPVRHGMTIGELARYFAELDSLPEPSVITLDDWNGRGLPADYQWVYPSPNMPTPETSQVYPGMCLLEATNVSEGRGTTRPFSIFGAPWVDGRKMADELNGTYWLEGARLRPHSFIPTFGKHAGEICGGCEIHLTERDVFRSLRCASGILLRLFQYSSTSWNDPPYEYEYSLMPVDILAGGTGFRKALCEGDEDTLMEMSRGNSESHAAMVGKALLYLREFES
jgi:uncharacterized protein YbbC (DUF1343 family)